MLFGLFWETIIKEEEDPISFMREKTRYHIFYESLRKKIPHRSITPAGILLLFIRNTLTVYSRVFFLIIVSVLHICDHQITSQTFLNLNFVKFHNNNSSKRNRLTIERD